MGALGRPVVYRYIARAYDGLGRIEAAEQARRMAGGD